ncbi:peptidoglycan -binding protein [Paracoccus xiamenensis]|uniref:peptidoglycan -binding protein n=1 Tax=Paracoccus xiamenensis TaxID=2714901 RepID=UPI00140BF5C0|nr:peptidoglycan -binding protein [Paracoccus xiamenensis]NHF72212.1 peptidoglycan -binding protein [Paracoccus xiamenensis]
MALLRGRGVNRFSATIWPGFVDAMTALLMVLMFVITIFMVVQSVLRDTVDRQESQLDRLGQQVAGLSSTLSVTQGEKDAAQAGLTEAQARILDFETQVARLAQARDAESQRAGAAEAALGAARTEIDAAAEAARLAAARREALEALVKDLEAQNSDAGQKLTETEAARLTEAAAAEALRARLRSSEAELTAMTLSLEESRKQAEDTLTLLAAAEAAKRDLTAQAGGAASEAERQAALLAVAQEKLAGEQKSSDEAQRRVALLNQQVATLNQQLSAIQQALNATENDKQAAEVRLEDLGLQLNAALLSASQEQQRRLTLEEAERKRLEAEAADLARYRSEFFGRLSEVLQGREGVQVVGDRFVFQSEVLFGMGEATLSEAGRASIARVTTMLQDIAQTIPSEIDWVIRVDGHTDSTPLSGAGRYRDNWELSQARALAVVRYMVDELDFPADRLAPTGFAETRPLAPEDSPENRARNRRIELKLTER